MAPESEAAAEPAGLRTHPLTGLVQGALWAAAASFGLISSVFSGDGWGGMSPWLSLLIALACGLVLGMGVGFLGWYFTRYVIDGTELRINHGIITKASRRIPYERLQSVDIAEPLLARIFGLAELRIEMAGGKDSRTSLRFLTLADARSLRRVHWLAPTARPRSRPAGRPRTTAASSRRSRRSGWRSARCCRWTSCSRPSGSSS